MTLNQSLWYKRGWLKVWNQSCIDSMSNISLQISSYSFHRVFSFDYLIKTHKTLWTRLFVYFQREKSQQQWRAISATPLPTTTPDPSTSRTTQPGTGGSTRATRSSRAPQTTRGPNTGSTGATSRSSQQTRSSRETRSSMGTSSGQTCKPRCIISFFNDNFMFSHLLTIFGDIIPILGVY